MVLKVDIVSNDCYNVITTSNRGNKNEKFAILNMKEKGYVMGLVAESKFDAIHMGVEHAKKINNEKFVELNQDRNLSYEDVLEKMGLIIIDIDERTSDSLLQFPYGGPIAIMSAY